MYKKRDGKSVIASNVGFFFLNDLTGMNKQFDDA